MQSQTENRCKRLRAVADWVYVHIHAHTHAHRDTRTFPIRLGVDCLATVERRCDAMMMMMMIASIVVAGSAISIQALFFFRDTLIAHALPIDLITLYLVAQ